jgi:hypothetical protein
MPFFAYRDWLLDQGWVADDVLTEAEWEETFGKNELSYSPCRRQREYSSGDGYVDEDYKSDEYTEAEVSLVARGQYTETGTQNGYFITAETPEEDFIIGDGNSYGYYSE